MTTWGDLQKGCRRPRKTCTCPSDVFPMCKRKPLQIQVPSASLPRQTPAIAKKTIVRSKNVQQTISNAMLSLKMEKTSGQLNKVKVPSLPNTLIKSKTHSSPNNIQNNKIKIPEAIKKVESKDIDAKDSSNTFTSTNINCPPYCDEVSSIFQSFKRMSLEANKKIKTCSNKILQHLLDINDILSQKDLDFKIKVASKIVEKEQEFESESYESNLTAITGEKNEENIQEDFGDGTARLMSSVVQLKHELKEVQRALQIHTEVTQAKLNSNSIEQELKQGATPAEIVVKDMESSFCELENQLLHQKSICLQKMRDENEKYDSNIRKLIITDNPTNSLDDKKGDELSCSSESENEIWNVTELSVNNVDNTTKEKESETPERKIPSRNPSPKKINENMPNHTVSGKRSPNREKYWFEDIVKSYYTENEPAVKKCSKLPERTKTVVDIDMSQIKPPRLLSNGKVYPTNWKEMPNQNTNTNKEAINQKATNWESSAHWKGIQVSDIIQREISRKTVASAEGVLGEIDYILLSSEETDRHKRFESIVETDENEVEETTLKDDGCNKAATSSSSSGTIDLEDFKRRVANAPYSSFPNDNLQDIFETDGSIEDF